MSGLPKGGGFPRVLTGKRVLMGIALLALLALGIMFLARGCATEEEAIPPTEEVVDDISMIGVG